MRNKRIAIKSNYDSETYDEHFLNVPAMDEDSAWRICNVLNRVQPCDADYYTVVDVDYTLYKFEP